MEYADTFRFLEAKSDDEAVAKILATVDEELASGLSSDDICILSPYRRSTKTGVNQINPLLQKKFIHTQNAEALKYGDKVFYTGDKVMSMANVDDIANGDTGVITKIDGNKFEVDFKDGRIKSFAKGDLKNFELAYCITIHKSQGSEWPSCIIVLMDNHSAMLKRNLLYTALSRAKQRITIIGTMSAFETAVKTEDASKRCSRLGAILQKELQGMKS